MVNEHSTSTFADPIVSAVHQATNRARAELTASAEIFHQVKALFAAIAELAEADANVDRVFRMAQIGRDIAECAVGRFEGEANHFERLTEATS
ncbi:hypothetical protein NCW_00215 [Burkholderia pseudomallei]